MNKGFSLVELLAVMVILGVLALITVPAVLNIVNESKTSSVMLSANHYLSATKLAITRKMKEDIEIDDGSYAILKNGNICIGNLNDNDCDNELVISAEKNLPKGGFVRVENGEVKTALLEYDKMLIARNENGEVTDKLDFVCLPATSKTVTTGNIPIGNFNDGDEYICKVNKKLEYHFFVVGSSENKVNLILNRNINSDGTLAEKQVYSTASSIYSASVWNSVEDYKNASGDTDATKSFTTYGPITAMNFVNKATENWDNIPNINDFYIDESISINTGQTVDGYGSFELTGKARLPKYSEVFGNNKCGLEEVSCPLWLINYMLAYELITGEGVVNLPKGSNNIGGYWLMSSTSEQTYKRYAWVVTYKGNLVSVMIEQYATRGIRPVIEVPKELILH